MFLIILLNFASIFETQQFLIISKIICLFILTSVAVKSAISLSILIKFYKINGTISIKFNSKMKG